MGSTSSYATVGAAAVLASVCAFACACACVCVCVCVCVSECVCVRERERERENVCPGGLVWWYLVLHGCLVV